MGMRRARADVRNSEGRFDRAGEFDWAGGSRPPAGPVRFGIWFEGEVSKDQRSLISALDCSDDVFLDSLLLRSLLRPMPRTRYGHDNEPPALEDPSRMSVAALQTELQQLCYEFRKDPAGNRLEKAGLVTRLAAAR